VLPVAGAFARLVERLVPDRPARLAAGLDPRFLAESSVALGAVGVTLARLTRTSFAAVQGLLRSHPGAEHELPGVRDAVDETQRYLARIQTPGPSGRVDPRELAALHAIDQLQRLLDRCEQRDRVATLPRDAELQRDAERLAEHLDSIEAAAEPPLEQLEAQLVARREGFRRETLERASTDALPNPEALARLDAHRWLERVTHHAWRIVHHLAVLRLDHPAPESGAEPPEPD
jgi:phosphate:Na+ symporter